METGKMTIELFEQHYNCSQAVLMGTSSVSGLSIKQSEALSSGFGGGMTLQETCGAITGACMAISHAVFNTYSDPAKGKEQANNAVNAFMKSFEVQFGKYRCIELTDIDFSVDGALDRFLSKGGKRETLCLNIVEFASNETTQVIETYTKTK